MIEWRDFDWRMIRTKVMTLQTEIYKLSRKGKTKELHIKQHELITSMEAKQLAVRRVTMDSSGKKKPLELIILRYYLPKKGLN